MKILIVGSSGMLGNILKRYLESFYGVASINREVVDLSLCSFSELEEKIVKTSPNVVINCCGVIKQRTNIKKIETIQVNSVIPNWLSEICKKKNLNFIHITTDCVFNGSKGYYTELDSHNCSDVYGMSKSLGEPENATIIRTSIIGHEKNNKLSLFEWVLSNKNKTISGFSNHYWNGVTCLQLSKIIKQIIEEKNFWTGVRHIYSNKVSKYELVSYINDVYKLNIDIRSVDDQKQIDRTLFSIFNVSNFKIPTIQEQIEEMFYFYQQEIL
jgi:dTDP-4-dehydrorhamnose reductase